MTSKTLTWMLGAVLAAASAQSNPAELIVHEWGTFTSFQDERGTTIAGINVDDEPVPKFVHRLGDIPIYTTSSLPATWSKNAPACHPDVTLRLETPVLYFHPSAHWKPAPFDVSASFVGGWLTEFFPAAEADAGGFPGALSSDSRSTLTWRGVQLNNTDNARLPSSDAHVWLAPRNVDAATVVNSQSEEAEKYLFYRGVGHLDAPIVVTRVDDTLNFALREGATDFATLPQLWIVDVGANGHLLFRTVKPTGRTAQAPAYPSAIAGALNNRLGLQRELSAALKAAGLNADEAAAMLDTWKLSYFDSAGLRVFFLLPRTWIDARLPLDLSTPADITRVMVGRIELLTQTQRKTLARLYALPETAFPRQPVFARSAQVLKAMQGGKYSAVGLYQLAGTRVPESLVLYHSLGRFRDALLNHELKTEVDPARRARLDLVMRHYSACVSTGQN